MTESQLEGTKTETEIKPLDSNRCHFTCVLMNSFHDSMRVTTQLELAVRFSPNIYYFTDLAQDEIHSVV